MHPARRDIAKVLAYGAGSLVLGAALAPWLYQAGQAFAEVSAGRAGSPVAAWVADAARRFGFERCFGHAVGLAALVLLVPTLCWLRVGGAGRGAPRAGEGRGGRRGQPLRPNPRGWRDASAGLLLGGTLVAVVGWLLAASGWFRWRQGPDVVAVVGEALGRGAAAALVEEVVFRGVVLGMLLRALRPAAAVAAAALLFAVVHFMGLPAGVEVTVPEAAGAGFEMLGHICGRFGDPAALIGGFGPLLAAGLVLGYARWRTASLWLPGGLHAGWVVALRLFKGFTLPVHGIHPPARYLVGPALREGIVPMVVMLAIGLLVHAFTARHARELQLEA